MLCKSPSALMMNHSSVRSTAVHMLPSRASTAALLRPRPPFCLGSPRAAGGAAGHLMDNPEYSIDNGVVSAAPPPVVCHVKSSRGVDFEAMQDHLQRSTGCLGLDTEGREDILLLQIHAPSAGNPGAMFPSTVYLVDPIEAGEGRDALLGSLKPMLEGPAIKIMHDCSRDSQLLLAKTGAHLRNVLDTQVMVAAHQLLNHAEFKGTTVWGGCGHKLADVGGGWPNKAGLAKLMQVFGFEHQHKEAVNAKMNQIRKSGGTASVFSERPMSPELLAYAAADARYLTSIARLALGDPKAQKNEWALTLALSQIRADLHYKQKESAKEAYPADVQACAKGMLACIQKAKKRAYMQGQNEGFQMKRSSKWMIEILMDLQKK